MPLQRWRSVERRRVTHTGSLIPKEGANLECAKLVDNAAAFNDALSSNKHLCSAA